MKTFKIRSDYNMKTSRSLKRRAILKILTTVFYEANNGRRCSVYIVNFEHISLFSSVFIVDFEQVNVSWVQCFC